MTKLRENEQAGGERVKPRLLVLASTYPRWLGDHEPRFVHELSKRLTDHFEVTVVGPHAAGAPADEVMDGVHVRRFRYAPARFETLVNDGGIVTNLGRYPWKWLLVPAFGLAMLWSTWRIVQRNRPDVVHAHWLIPQGVIVALLHVLLSRMPPYVVTSHGADLYALRAKPLQWLKRWVMRRAARLTVVSSAMRDELMHMGVDSAKVSVQPMGVDLVHRFAPNPAIKRSHDEILFVGRLVEKKGLRYLIDAMPSIVQARPRTFLTVAGFGPEEAALREQVARLGLGGQVDFLGAVEQSKLPDLYHRAAVFVAPFIEAVSGDREGLGLVVVEAAGCACPVVVSDLPTVRQVFLDSTGAVMAPPGDPAALAAAVLSVLEGRAAPPGTAELERLHAAFDWESRAQQYASLLAVAISQSRVSL